MKELTLINKGGKILADSREIAERVGKEHKNLMRDIREYSSVIEDGSKLSSQDFFLESTYINSQHKSQPCYLITRKGCDMIANKLTGTKGILFTAEYVTDFEKMEAQLNKQYVNSYMIQDPIERAKAWIKEEQQRQLLAAQIEKDKPKVQFFDAVAGSKDSIEMGQVAKVLAVKGLGRNKLFELLRQKKVLQKDNIPYQKYVDAGYFRVLEQKYTVPSGETKVNIKTMVFQKGIDYIRKIIKEA